MDMEKIQAFKLALASLPIIEPDRSDFINLCPHLSIFQVEKIVSYDLAMFAVPDLDNENGYVVLLWSDEEESSIPDDPDDYDPEFDDGHPRRIEFFTKVNSPDETVVPSVAMFATEAMLFAKNNKSL